VFGKFTNTAIVDAAASLRATFHLSFLKVYGHYTSVSGSHYLVRMVWQRALLTSL